MSELSDALRTFAGNMDKGLQLDGATQCTLVLSDDSGQTKVTYIGRLTPAKSAGIHMLARGIQAFNETPDGPMVMQATRGSTH